MSACRQSKHHNIAFHSVNDNRRVEPNTGAPDENPVLISKDGTQGVSIITIVIIAVLVVAVAYAVLN